MSNPWTKGLRSSLASVALTKWLLFYSHQHDCNMTCIIQENNAYDMIIVEKAPC